MSIAMDIFFAVPFTMLFSALMYAATGVGCCEWSISSREVPMDVAFKPFSNNTPNYASVYDAMGFLIVIHSKCTGPFSGVIDFIGV